MKKMVWSRLSKKNKKHLRDNKIFYLWQFEKQIKFMKKQQLKHTEHPMGYCWECMVIADKLGLWRV